MKITQIVESKDSLLTYLRLINKHPDIFKLRLNKTIKDYKSGMINNNTFQTELDSISDDIENLVHSQLFQSFDNNAELSLLIDEFETIDNAITNTRQIGK